MATAFGLLRFGADVHYQEPNAATTLASALASLYRAQSKGPSPGVPILFLVGAPCTVGDSVGPLVGWFLDRLGYPGPRLGDLGQPVHASNLNRRLAEARGLAAAIGRPAWILAIDAAIGSPGRLIVRPGPLQPGKAAGRIDLPPVGNAHLLASVAQSAHELWFGVSLHEVITVAELIAKAVAQFWLLTQDRVAE